MGKSNLKTIGSSINAKSASVNMPRVYDPELQHKIEREAFLKAEKDRFRNSSHFYWLSAARDFGC